MRFPEAVRHEAAIEHWLQQHQASGLGEMARHWFERMRRCGGDVCELLHDGHPTACVGDAAFADMRARVQAEPPTGSVRS